MKLGQVRISLTDDNVVQRKDNHKDAGKDLREPVWCPLWFAEPGDGEGEILVSVELIKRPRVDTWMNPSPSIVPELEKRFLELTVLGLRSLNFNDFFFLKPRKPFVSFYMSEITNATMQKKKNDCLHTTQSSSRPTAANPNYLNRVVVPIMLPKKQLYMPRLGMHVFDTKYLFGKGKVTKNSSLICTAKVDVARLIEWEDLSNADVYIEHEAEAARIVLREGYFFVSGNIKSNDNDSNLHEGNKQGGKSLWHRRYGVLDRSRKSLMLYKERSKRGGLLHEIGLHDAVIVEKNPVSDATRYGAPFPKNMFTLCFSELDVASGVTKSNVLISLCVKCPVDMDRWCSKITSMITGELPIDDALEDDELDVLDKAQQNDFYSSYMYKSGSDLAKMGSYKKRYFILDVDLDAKDRKEYVSVLKYYMDRGVAGKGYKQKGTIYLTGDGCRFGIIAWPRTTRLFLRTPTEI